MCFKKLDVLDGLSTIKICTGYRLHGKDCQYPPVESELFAQCEPVYEELPGWTESTAEIRRFAELPLNAQKYLLHVEELAGVPIDIISTGADRKDTIMLRNPFDNGIEKVDEFYAEERT